MLFHIVRAVSDELYRTNGNFSIKNLRLEVSVKSIMGMEERLFPRVARFVRNAFISSFFFFFNRFFLKPQWMILYS